MTQNPEFIITVAHSTNPIHNSTDLYLIRRQKQTAVCVKRTRVRKPSTLFLGGAARRPTFLTDSPWQDSCSRLRQSASWNRKVSAADSRLPEQWPCAGLSPHARAGVLHPWSPLNSSNPVSTHGDCMRFLGLLGQLATSSVA